MNHTHRKCPVYRKIRDESKENTKHTEHNNYMGTAYYDDAQLPNQRKNRTTHIAAAVIEAPECDYEGAWAVLPVPSSLISLLRFVGSGLLQCHHLRARR